MENKKIEFTTAQEIKLVSIMKAYDRFIKGEEEAWDEEAEEDFYVLCDEFGGANWYIETVPNYEGWYALLDEDAERAICVVDLSMIDLGDYEIYY